MKDYKQDLSDYLERELDEIALRIDDNSIKINKLASENGELALLQRKKYTELCKVKNTTT